MALSNLYSLTLSAAELKAIDDAIDALAAALKGKTINLSPQERAQYGRIADQNKIFVNKAKTYMEQNPEFVPNFVDKAEFDADFIAREQLESRYNRVMGLAEQLSDTKTLLDHDNYQNAISFYRNIRFLSQENVPGINTVYEDMSSFFKKGIPAGDTSANKTEQ